MSTQPSSLPSVGRETFTSSHSNVGPGIWLFLHWRHGLCVLDVVVDFTHVADTPPWDAIDVEILSQPRNDRGLPDGGPLVLWRKRVELRCIPGTRRSGSLTLPRSFVPEAARNYFYRVNACGIG
jgi:hypothetical protein